MPLTPGRLVKANLIGTRLIPDGLAGADFSLSLLADYYVDATLGNDSNTGRSSGAPWKTIAKVNAATFLPGDQVSFKKGETWRENLTNTNPKFAYGTKFDIGHITSYYAGKLFTVSGLVRSVIKLSGVYYCFMEVSNAGIYSIQIRRSTNCIDWTQIITPLLAVGAGGSFDEKGQADPCTMIEAGTWKLWYTGQDVASHLVGVGYATSADGVTWTKYQITPVFALGTAGQWDDGQLHHQQVLKVGSTYYMLYTATGTGHTYEEVGMATSPDGIVWTRYGGNPIILSGAVATDGDYGGIRSTMPVLINSVWYMLYWGINGAETRIMLATSTDLYTWTKWGVWFSGSLSGDELHGVTHDMIVIDGDIAHHFYQNSAGTVYAWSNQVLPNAAVINNTTLRTGWAWTGDGLGSVTLPATVRGFGPNYLLGIKITIGASDIQAAAVRFYSGLNPASADYRVKAAIYTFDSTTAGTLVASSQSDEMFVLARLGWNRVAIPGTPTLTAGASYWVVLWSNIAINATDSTTSTTKGFVKAATYDATWPAGFTGASTASEENPAVVLVPVGAEKNIYQITGIVADPGTLYQDVTPLALAGSAVLLAGQYYWDGANILYVRTTDSANPNLDKVIQSGIQTVIY